jgi:hypothetical protein
MLIRLVDGVFIREAIFSALVPSWGHCSASYLASSSIIEQVRVFIALYLCGTLSSCLVAFRAASLGRGSTSCNIERIRVHVVYQQQATRDASCTEELMRKPFHMNILFL